MQIRIYFDHRFLLLTDRASDSSNLEFYEEQLLKNILAELKENKIQSAAILGNPEALMTEVRRHFKTIQAAGGLVINENREALLIYRREKWDLPKGKLDKGEDLETCAVREVEEETGLQQLTLLNKITVTYHTYEHKGQDVLKESHWFLMNTGYRGVLHPQLDEDIVECRWAPFETLDEYRVNIHASVNDVLDYAKPYLI